MPIYEYRCDKRHNFEVLQRMSDESLTKCTVCGAPVQRVFHPIAVHFKGSGFYNTDYGKQKRGNSGSSSDEGPKSSDDGAKSTDKGSKSSDDGGAGKSSDKGKTEKSASPTT